MSPIDVLLQRLAAAVHLEDVHAAFQVGVVDGDLPVEAAGAQQAGSRMSRAVGGRHDDDAFVHRKAVHLHQQLVKGLFALVVPAAQARAAMAAHAVDLVDKDNGGRGLLGLVKQIAHAAGATPTNISTKSEPEMEKNGAFACAGHSLGQQRFARARGPTSSTPLGMRAPYRCRPLGFFRKSTIS